MTKVFKGGIWTYDGSISLPLPPATLVEVPIPGPKGDPGEKGDKGDQGEPGADGGGADPHFLTANVDYYVNAATGDDANDGLSSDTAFATVTKAIGVCATLIQGPYMVTIYVADGLYFETAAFSGFPGKSNNTTGNAFRIIGNVSNPQSVLLAFGLNITGSFSVEIAGIDVGLALFAYSGSKLFIHDCRLNVISSSGGSIIQCEDCAFYPGFIGFAVSAVTFGAVELRRTTVVDTPDYSKAFALATSGSIVFLDQPSGSATGKRFVSEQNGIIQTYGGGLSYLPGSTAGVEDTATGGLYL